MKVKNLLIAIIGINSLIQAGLAVMLLFNLDGVLNFMHLTYSDDLKVFSTYFISAILIIAPLGVVTISWLRHDRSEGLFLSKFIGWTMVVASVNIICVIHRWDLAAMDLARGIPILILAYMMKRGAF